METTATKRTITLSGRPPVRIIEDDWPIVAQASDEWYEGQVRSQSFRSTDQTIKVRQHADGRAIVYGVYQHSTAWQSERSIREAAGYLLAAPDTDEIVATVERVARELAERLDDSAMDRLGRECIADLPADEI